MSDEEFEKEWQFKPVKIKGAFDMLNEIPVEKKKNYEVGYDIVVPLYTHLNADGKECGILVNRGWVPKDFLESRDHLKAPTMGYTTGILYRGD